MYNVSAYSLPEFVLCIMCNWQGVERGRERGRESEVERVLLLSKEETINLNLTALGKAAAQLFYSLLLL